MTRAASEIRSTAWTDFAQAVLNPDAEEAKGQLAAGSKWFDLQQLMEMNRALKGKHGQVDEAQQKFDSSFR